MSTWGNDGVAKFGGNAIARIDSFNYDETVTPVGDSSMGDAAEGHIEGSGLPGWTAAMELSWDKSDTDGQEAAIIGAAVDLEMYPEGDASGDAAVTGRASVVKVGLAVPKGDRVTKSVEFLGNGVLTHGVVD